MDFMDLFMLEHGIKEVEPNLGWSEDEQQWYGWSHRAISGFGVGSKVVKGDIGYVAMSTAELINDYAEFFADVGKADHYRSLCVDKGDHIRIYTTKPDLRWHTLLFAWLGLTESQNYHVRHVGKGEWEAKCLTDAHLMAVNFAEAIS